MDRIYLSVEMKQATPLFLDPMDHSRPIENYTSSNLPYGDFSYLTDIISTHFNQSTQQAYQNMMQINPLLAANALSNALSSQGIPLLPPGLQNLENIKNQPPLQDKHVAAAVQNLLAQQMKQAAAFNESSIEKNTANSTEALNLKKDDKFSQNVGTLPETITKIQEMNTNTKIINLESNSKAVDTPSLNNCERNNQVMMTVRDLTENEDGKPKQKVMMVGDCQIVKIRDTSEGSSKVVTTIGDCTIQPVSQHKWVAATRPDAVLFVDGDSFDH